MGLNILQPIAPKTALGEPSELIIQEKKLSLTGDDATIYDSNQNPVFQIVAKTWSMSAQRELRDAKTGETLAVFRRALSKFIPTYYIGPPDNPKLGEIQIAISMQGLVSVDASIYLKGKKVGSVSGDWRAKVCEIMIGNQKVAKITRNTSLMNKMFAVDSYETAISGGVDRTFIALIVVAIDEIYRDDRGKDLL